MCNIYIYFKYYGICIIPGVARVKSLVFLNNQLSKRYMYIYSNQKKLPRYLKNNHFHNHFHKL